MSNVMDIRLFDNDQELNQTARLVKIRIISIHTTQQYIVKNKVELALNRQVQL